MSWHFLQGQEEASWQEPSLTGAPSALLNLIPTAVACSSPVNVTASSPAFPSGTTLPRLTGAPGRDTSMSLAGASRAKTSPLPGSAPALLAHAQAYGQSSPVSLGKYDPATHLLRTFQGLLFEASTACLQTLPRWGWMHAGAVWGLMTSERPISVNASGYLPTPAAISYGTNQGGAAGRVGKIRPSLETMARREMWPPPDASDWKQDGLTASQRRLELYSTCSLNAAVRMWPTPNVPNGGRTTWHAEEKGHSLYYKGKKVQLVLEQAVRLATPTSRDWRSGKASLATHDKNSRPLSEQIGGQLNPTWVCWLLGWPLDWEGIGPLSPQTFHAWLQVSQTAYTACEPWAMDGAHKQPS